MTFQLNPVAVRESRAMWRGARSFLLLLCYAGALSIVAYLAYSSEVRSASYWASEYGGEMQVQSARVGRTLFVALSAMQLVAWLLIAPALSATSVSSERERGLLESLLMSNLRPRQIIVGKFAVSASFVAILIVATLPVLAICFMLGGVSPGEFGGVLALQLATAFCALSLGVWCSTSLRLSTHALGATFAALVGWMLLTCCVVGVISTSYWGLKWGLKDNHILGLFCALNPFIGLVTLLDNNSNSNSAQPFGIPMNSVWAVSSLAQTLAGLLFLHLASRALARPADAEEEAPHRSRKARRNANIAAAITWSGEAAGAPVATLEDEAFAVREPQGAGQEDGHFSIPLLSSIVGGSPLMRHHLRASWRWKKPRGKARKWWMAGAVLFGMSNLMAACYIISEPRGSEGVLWMLLAAAALTIPVFVTASSGLSIARDRELGMWNHLRLSSIRSEEIARAKMLTPLISALAYALPLMAPLGFFAWCILRNDNSWNNINSHGWSNGAIMLCAVALTLPLWILGTLQLSGWALICSTRAKRSSIALVAAFAGGLIFLIGLPVVIELSQPSGYSGSDATRHLHYFLGLFHPFYAMHALADVMEMITSSEPPSHPSAYVAFPAALASHAAITYGFYRKVAADIARRER